ncbi:hypothetical protein D3C85_534030 [compost metagenome]
MDRLVQRRFRKQGNTAIALHEVRDGIEITQRIQGLEGLRVVLEGALGQHADAGAGWHADDRQLADFGGYPMRDSNLGLLAMKKHEGFSKQLLIPQIGRAVVAHGGDGDIDAAFAQQLQRLAGNGVVDVNAGMRIGLPEVSDQLR